MFYSVLKSLSEKLVKVKIEMKNDIEIKGNLVSVDNNLNIALNNVSVDEKKYPQFIGVNNCFIRGNTIRYIHFNKNEVEYDLIEEACRKAE